MVIHVSSKLKLNKICGTDHPLARVDISPIYTAENFWHGSDEKSTRTKKIGSARIDLVV